VKFLSAAVVLFAIGLRALFAYGYLLAGQESVSVVPLCAALSEAVAIVATVYAFTWGRPDYSAVGLLLPFLHLPVLLLDLRGPLEVNAAMGLYLMLWPLQLALRVRMGLCCTVAVPCFVKLLDGFPYSKIRHPLALLELMIVSALAVSYASPWNVFALVLAIAANICCVLIEERFLRSEPQYLAYCERVKWRFAPGVW